MFVVILSCAFLFQVKPTECTLAVIVKNEPEMCKAKACCQAVVSQKTKRECGTLFLDCAFCLTPLCVADWC